MMNYQLCQGIVSTIQTLRNPDAILLSLGLVLFMPNARDGTDIATEMMDQLMQLSDRDRIASTLPQLASSGLLLPYNKCNGI